MCPAGDSHWSSIKDTFIMKRQVAGSRWYRVGLLFLVCLFLNMDSSTAQLTREQLLDTCDNQNRQEALAGTERVDLTCDATQAGDSILGDVTWSLQRVGEADAALLDTSLPKYSQSFHRLAIGSIVADDDGLYRCHFNSSDDNSQTNESAGCIYVLGTAKFASCEDTTPCSENIPAVMSPNAIVLNVSVDFFRQGASGQNQRVILLNLYNSIDISGQEPIYTCRNEGSIPCADSGRIVVEQGGSHKFDIVLRITNSTPEDSGTYTAIVEVENPHTSGLVNITKTFMVTVTAIPSPVTHTPSAPSPTSTILPSAMQPIPVPTTNTPSPTASNTDGADSSDQTVVIAVAVPLSFMILILMIIFVVAVIFLATRRNQRTQHEAHTHATNPEIELTKSPSKQSVDQLNCPVCLTEPRITALTCGHLLCSECAQKVDNCPICRQPISHRIRLFQ